MEFGTYLHYLLEIIDFKNIDYKLIPKEYKIYIDNFLNSDLLKNLNEANIYKEYEFIYLEKGFKKHGVIDLILEYDNKLKNIDDQEYDKQVKGYLEYIKKKSEKEIHGYLYSIMDFKYREVL